MAYRLLLRIWRCVLVAAPLCPLLTFSLTVVASTNPIQIENARTGTTAWRLDSAARNGEIEGYASLTSVNRGGDVTLFVNTAEHALSIDVFRIGWYGSLGGRRMLPTITMEGEFSQPAAKLDAATGLIECDWSPTYRLHIPASADASEWASGFYVAKLTALATKKQAYVVFVVRDDARNSDIIVASAATTWAAYNNWGGKSLYDYNSSGLEARKVTFDRPYAEDFGSGELFRYEGKMARWLEREGYDVTYATDVDTHSGRTFESRHKAFLSVGHDEYWSYEMRANIERARDSGVNLGFFGGNVCFWQIRLEASSWTGEPSRTVICYKFHSASEDPLFTKAPQLATVRWRDAPVNRPEAALVGVQYEGGSGIDGDVVVTRPYHWVFRNTGLMVGSRLRGVLGYEIDSVASSSPPSLYVLAHTSFTRDDGSVVVSDMAIYQAESGAFVFAAGTIQWSYGLDDVFISPSRVATEVIVTTRNVLARLLGISGVSHRAVPL